MNEITEKDVEEYTLDKKDEMHKRDISLNPQLFLPKEIDISEAYYELDILQNKLLEKYLRQDMKFRIAFHTNYTPYFFQFLIDKVRLKEPHHLATMGTIRGGKSYSMITIICFINALYGRKTSVNYICGNAHEFLEHVKMMPSSMTLNSAFLIDEDKQAVFGYGSVARQQKISDVQNIIAMNNISTISINPTKFTNTDAFYGLRAFGRCTKTKTCRFMLYNLQESTSGHLPLGMVYIPIFPEVVPYWRELEIDYLVKKKTWIQNEAMGLGDVLMKLQKREAERFYNDEQFREIKGKKNRLTYIRMRLGSEWTLNQVEEILVITGLMEKYRVKLDEDKETETKETETKETETEPEIVSETEVKENGGE